jgi:uncharacterized membrane protein
MRGHRDLTWACAAAVVCGAGAVLIPVAALSFVFLAPLAFLLTGYAILSAALPRWRAEPTLKAAASLGISLAVLALGGLILNYVGGLKAAPWAILLVVIVIACARGAAIRRPRGEGQRIVLATFPRPGVLSVLAVVLGLLAAGASLAFAFHPVSAPRAVGYSELWIDTGASESSFKVGVGNQEHTPFIYGLIATINGAETVERHVELNPGERQVLTLPVEGRTRTGPLRVGVTLYREGFPNQPYRHVSGWVPTRSAAP